MSHIVNVIQKTDIKKSLVMLIEESKKQSSKIKINKNEIILNLDNDSWFVFYGNTKTLLKIENKNHSSFNSDTQKNLLKKQINIASTPLTSYVNQVQNINNKIKVKEVQLSLKKQKSRLIFEKAN
jgi:hypothetical protein